jgi:pantoate--beta-alanine ligase
MEIVRIPRIMREGSKKNILRNKTIGFIPTMGALHEGHISLIKRAREENDIVVVSIFINPLQFGKNEDFDSYPRDLEGDMEKLKKCHVDILFIPDESLMYGNNFCTYVDVRSLSDKLCGHFRPGHFTGVATVVCKLFNIVMPNRAYFGQKDFQQTVIIRRMIDDLNMNVDLIICPTIREADGLAMSSRNAYLSNEERKSATIIYKTLIAASGMIKSGANNPKDVVIQMHNTLKTEPLVSEIQYAGVYDIETLDELKEFKKQNLLAIAVKIGNTRLIDNMIVEL